MLTAVRETSTLLHSLSNITEEEAACPRQDIYSVSGVWTMWVFQSRALAETEPALIFNRVRLMHTMG